MSKRMAIGAAVILVLGAGYIVVLSWVRQLTSGGPAPAAPQPPPAFRGPAAPPSVKGPSGLPPAE